MNPAAKTLRLVSFFVFLILLLGAQPASSGDRVIVIGEDDSIVRNRLIKELVAVGFDAIPYAGDAETLETIAEKMQAAAVVRFTLKGYNLDVWVADQVTNKTVHRSLSLSNSGPVDTIAVIAAVELLRASLMELHATTPPPGNVTPEAATAAFSKPKPITQSAPPPKNDWDGETALGAGMAMAGVRTGVGMRLPLSAAIHFQRLVYLRLYGALFLTGTERRVPEGGIRFEPWFAGGEVGFSFFRMRPPIYPFLGIGSGASFIHVEGEAESSFNAKKRWFIRPVLYARGGIGIPIADRFVIQTALSAGMALKIDSVTVVGKERARLGEPLMSFDFMFGIRL